MKTTCDISTISYNSVEFLTDMLNDLYLAHAIEFWCFVPHLPETFDDGTLEKPHIHLFVRPHKSIDTMALSKLSEEFDPKCPEHPLKCIYWRKSEWSNWLLYGLHDETYLKLKLEKREFCYSYDDFFCSDADEFFERFNDAMHSSTISDMLRLPRLLETNTVPQLVALGYVRPDQAQSFSVYEKLLNRGKAQLMHNRKTHD